MNLLQLRRIKNAREKKIGLVKKRLMDFVSIFFFFLSLLLLSVTGFYSDCCLLLQE